MKVYDVTKTKITFEVGRSLDMVVCGDMLDKFNDSRTIVSMWFEYKGKDIELIEGDRDSIIVSIDEGQIIMLIKYLEGILMQCKLTPNGK